MLRVGRIKLGEEAPCRRHHLELVARPQRLGDVRGERAALETLHRDPQHPRADGCADRVVAALIGIVGADADREVLPLGEGVRVGELRRDVERHGHGVLGERLHVLDAQRVEHRVPSRAGDDLRRGLGHHWISVIRGP